MIKFVALGALVCALSGSVVLGFATSPAKASEVCTKEVACPVVPETSYRGSGDVRPNIHVTVCFTDREHRLISRADGSNEWVVHLRYPRGSYDRIATEHNTQCRDQWVTRGTKVAVYVTCPEYTGWVSTSAIVQGGTYTMDRVGGPEWSYRPI